jgi:single-strand DNA-binding protein
MLKTILTGRLGQDATVKSVSNGFDAISFTVACTETWVDKSGQKQEQTTWLNCTIWRKTGNTKIAEYLKKGTQVLIEGKPSARAWVSNTDNTAKSVLEIRVDQIELLGSPKQQQNNNNNNNQSSSSTSTPATTSSDTGSNTPIFSSNNDDLPF